MKNWQDQRSADFAAMLAEWGVPIERNGLTSKCIKTPDVTDRHMMEAAYLSNVRATFDVSRAEWVRLSLGNRVQFTCIGIVYEIIKYRDDAADVSINFDGVRLK